MADLADPRQRALPVGSLAYLSAGWWAMVGAIVSEGALFAYLLFSYYYFAVQPHDLPWPPEPPKLHLSLPNTIILIASSVVVWWGEQGAKKDSRWRLTFGLLIGFLMGCVFVYIQVKEWWAKGFTLESSAYGSLFFTITGFHMAHVIVGLIILLPLTVWSALGYFGPHRHAPVSIGAAYWHFVDGVWLTVFFTFYVTPYLS